MLFNSPEFMFAFLPLVFLLFNGIAARARLLALFLASLIFYGWWDLSYLPILLISIAFNYAVGKTILDALSSPGRSISPRLLLLIGIAGNLLALSYFKYADFFAANLAPLFGLGWHSQAVDLPLGISFFTFTQIAFLCDAAAGKVDRIDPKSYGLFVSYFPHLIAGPILHHKEMMPQFEALERGRRVSSYLIAAGLTMFGIGLFKKAILADGVAPFATSAFDAAAAGGQPTFTDALIGALSYSFQIYFDFSGYCDMAIGASAIFGVRLPVNFNSPYKSQNIIEFWRRWHMTLSRFLRDYLYIPLGGNRRGPLRRYANLLITMLLGGLWHGAGWTFVIWGGLHGLFLVLNHVWLALISSARNPGRVRSTVAWIVTFAAVTFAWIFFRAETFDAAISMIKGLFGFNGLVTLKPDSPWAATLAPLGVATHLRPVDLTDALTYLLPCAAIAFFLPNSQEVMRRVRLTIERVDIRPSFLPAWAPNEWWAGAVCAMIVVAIVAGQGDQEFLYFKF